MRTRWTDSADKHEIARADALHAVMNWQLRVLGYDPARVADQPAADLFIGRTRDGSQVLEVMLHRDARTGDVLIFHVMLLRSSTVERARQIVAQRKREQE